ncbi:TlpA family protein disulfide reductase [Cellulomonas cellasea]|uniref:Redoxin n=2 Tax=Cellulomonas cellasea TaxID=43670 RepID=A0A0A0B1R4_9CELL|nr:TlpA disulfide reductase family protein [Cellulomonas cellasea]KGM00750.1 redoxin [Cellulomonas cellasea DSM 20118]GEA86397.1 thiol-disulfide isomerase [Cellulomonas cellasea]
MTARATARSRARAPRRLGGAAVVAGLVLTLGLGACAPGDTNAADDVVGQGYESGDGSQKVWAAADRSEPVELAGTDFAGATQDVAAWRGDVVVLNTWYANCPPCRAEAPDLVDVALEYADQGVHLLGINGTDDVGAAEAFQRRFDVPYPSIADTDGTAIAALQGTVPVQAVPTTVVLDREGRVAARILGIAEGSTLRALLDDVLAEQPGATT